MTLLLSERLGINVNGGNGTPISDEVRRIRESILQNLAPQEPPVASDEAAPI